MQRVFLIVLILTSSASAGLSQDRAKPELFVGYSYQNTDSGIKSSDFIGTSISQTSLDNRFGLNGLNVSATGYFSKRVGITGDFSAAFENRTDNFGTIQATSKLSLYNITGGPQVKFFGTNRATPFIHALFGVARRSLRESALNPTTSPIASANDTTTSFAMNLGGGIDVRLNDRLDLRIIQLDYNPVFLRNRVIAGTDFPGRTINGIRLSIGLVVK